MSQESYPDHTLLANFNSVTSNLHEAWYTILLKWCRAERFNSLPQEYFETLLFFDEAGEEEALVEIEALSEPVHQSLMLALVGNQFVGKSDLWQKDKGLALLARSQKIIENMPSELQLYYEPSIRHLAYGLLRAGRLAEAEVVAKRVTRSFPDFWGKLAIRLAESGKLEEAREVIFNIEPNTVARLIALLQLIETHKRNDRQTRLDQEFEEVLRQLNDIKYDFFNLSSIVNLVELLAAVGKMELALDLLERLRFAANEEENDFTKVCAFNTIIMGFAVLGNKDEARAILKQNQDIYQQLELETFRFEMLLGYYGLRIPGLFDAFMALGNRDKAVDVLEEAYKEQVASDTRQTQNLRQIILGWLRLGQPLKATQIVSDINTLQNLLPTMSFLALELARHGHREQSASFLPTLKKLAQRSVVALSNARLSISLEITEKLLRTNRVEEIIVILRKLKDLALSCEFYKPVTDNLAELVKQLTIAGQFKEAETIVEEVRQRIGEIRQSEWFSSSWYAIAQGLIEVGKFEEAETIAARIGYDQIKVEILVLIAEGMLTLGRKAEAEDKLLEAYRQADAIKASNGSATGDDLFLKSWSLREVALALVKFGKLEEAKNIATRIKSPLRSWDYSPSILGEIARVLASTGQMQEALDLVDAALTEDKERDEIHGDLLLLRVVEGLVDSNQLEEALRFANKITFNNYKAKALLKVASVSEAMWGRERTLDLVNEAYKVAKEEENDLFRAINLEGVVGALLKLESREEALNLIQVHWLKAQSSMEVLMLLRMSYPFIIEEPNLGLQLLSVFDRLEAVLAT